MMKVSQTLKVTTRAEVDAAKAQNIETIKTALALRDFFQNPAKLFRHPRSHLLHGVQ